MYGLVPASIAAGGFAKLPALLALSSAPLAHLRPLDIAVIAIYFGMVIWIGFYLKGKSNTSEEFFMAGREMTAWIAGLSFVSANMGSLELMGWAGSAYQYGILATHWYWVGAIPAMLFLGLVMMPFYYVSKTHSVPGYLDLRYGGHARSVAAFSFAIEMILMSGVNMFAMAVVMKVVLGWDITFSIFVSSVAVALYVGLGGLRSAIFNEVLQFVLIWGGALLVPILGLYQAGGVGGLKRRIMANMQSMTGVAPDSYFHLWRDTGHFAANPMGVHWTGIVFGLGFVISFGYWTTDFLVVQRVLAAHNLLQSSARSSRWRFRSSSFCPDCSAWCCCRTLMAAAVNWWAKTWSQAARSIPRNRWPIAPAARLRWLKPTSPTPRSKRFWPAAMTPSCTATTRPCP
jgi:SSS family solute:Na+ symporter